MTRKLTLFTVCAFEIALILFVATWTAFANTGNLYACGKWAGINGIPNFAAKDDIWGRNFILTEIGEVLTILDDTEQKKQIRKIGKWNDVVDIYQTTKLNKYDALQLFFVRKKTDTIEIDSIHPLAGLEVRTICQK